MQCLTARALAMLMGIFYLLLPLSIEMVKIVSTERDYGPPLLSP